MTFAGPGSGGMPRSETSGLTGTPLAIDFIDANRGWALVQQGGCANFKSDCWQVTYIEETQDGGKTWSVMPIPDLASPSP